MQKAIVIVALLAAVAFATPIPYNDCSSGDTTVTLTNIDGSPFPFTKGVNLNIWVNGTLTKETTAGQFSLEVKLFGEVASRASLTACMLTGVHIFGQQGDLCSWTPSFACPAEPGAVGFFIQQSIPAQAPSGKYEIILSALDQDAAQMFCVDVTADIKAKGELTDQ